MVTDSHDAFLRLQAPLAAFFDVTYLVTTVTAPPSTCDTPIVSRSP